MDLSALGLTKNEAKAYETLLHLGKTTAAHISKESGVTYGRIYDILASLETKGLVKTIPEKTKKFIPSDPKSLAELIEKRKVSMDNLQKKISEMKSVYEQHEIEPVTIVKGKNNFYKILREIHGAKKYEYDIKYAFDTHPESIREVKRMKNSKVDYKIIGRIDAETQNNVQEWKKIVPEIKPITNNGVAMAIIDDDVLMITLIKSNTIMLFKDKPFIELMKEMFLKCYE